MKTSAQITRQNVDRQWEDIKKRQESTALGRLSQKLISIYELGKLWASLKPGESLVLTSDGAIYQGHAKLEKLKKLQECYSVERQEHHFAESDPDTTRQGIQYTHFSSNNNWDTQSRLANGTRATNRGGKKAQPKLDADFV